MNPNKETKIPTDAEFASQAIEDSVKWRNRASFWQLRKDPRFMKYAEDAATALRILADLLNEGV